MKVLERIFECRIGQQIEVGDMQFGFLKRKGTTDAIFTERSTVRSCYRMSSVCLSVTLVDYDHIG